MRRATATGTLRAGALIGLLAGVGGCEALRLKPLVTVEDDGGPDLDSDTGCTPVAWYTDADGDGFGGGTAEWACVAPSAALVAEGGDCADADPARNPGATESCNGQDDDCDGLTDEEGATGGTEFYVDADGDGHGSTTVVATACAAPAGTAAAPDDCDDTSAEIHPGAVEVCSGVDDDCDGLVDEDDPNLDVSTLLTVYADADADGYGAPGTDEPACAVRSGWSDNDGDCDDTDDGTNPGEVEDCSDTVDNDCDASTTCRFSGDHLPTDAVATVEPTSPNRQLGDALATGFDVNSDGIPDLVVGAPAADPGGQSEAGLAVVFLGPLSGTIDEADGARLEGVGLSDYAGSAVGSPGDVNQDGFDDLVVGAPGADEGGTNTGSVYLVHGPVSAGGTVDLGTVPVWSTSGGTSAIGYTVSHPVDFDDDGFEDLLLGAGNFDLTGQVALFLGPLTGGGSLDSPDHAWSGAHTLASLGSDFDAVGDLNGDGIDDLVLGSSRLDTAGAEAGGAYVLLGPLSAAPDLSAGTLWTGEGPGDGAGCSITRLGDADGDGLDDVVIGASGADGAAVFSGAAYLLHGPATGGGSLSGAAARYEGLGTDDLFAVGRGAGADLDGDGLADVVLAGSFHDGSGVNSGRAWLFYSPASGTVSITGATPSFSGSEGGDWLGEGLATGSDLNGNGTVDLVVGAPQGDPASVYVFDWLP